MAKKRILTEYQLERLKEHKYSSIGNTMIDPFLQYFWKWLVQQIPTTWAPNSITLTGLIGNIVTTIFLMIYCPKGYGYAPIWCYAMCAIGLFVYQSLDAIDGKQARRTSSSTPLGELFDHGCDAMSMVIIVLGACISTQMGTSPYSFIAISTMGSTLFYLAQWKTYNTNVMHFNFIDVTEGQLAVIATYSLNAIVGESFWDELIFGVKAKVVYWSIATLFTCFFILFFVYSMFLSEEAKLRNKEVSDAKGMNKRYVPYSLKPGVMVLLLWGLLVACSVCSMSQLVENNTVLFVVTFGIISTKMSCLVLVGHMTKSEMPLLDPIFLAPCILLACQIFQIADEFLCLVLVTTVCLVNLLYYVVRVCSDICDHLGIYCFKITPILITNN